MKTSFRILLCEDDELWALMFSNDLSMFGLVDHFDNEDDAIDALKSNKYDIAFIDLDLTRRLGGLSVVGTAKAQGVFSAIVSSHEETDVIEQGIAHGADEYIIKPCKMSSLTYIFKKLESCRILETKIKTIKDNFITCDPNTTTALKELTLIDQSDGAILVTGESGTGKKIVAEVAHKILCPDKQLISINCAALNESTLMSELFGHKKGSFTGSTQDQKGIFEKANGGVLFLDEVHLLSIKAQKALLKVIDEKVFTPLGAKEPKIVDFRLVCAARENIDELVEIGEFKDDLLNRIKTFRIDLSPLRARQGDIELIATHILSKKPSSTIIHKDALSYIKKYNWRNGNTRELIDFLENMYVKGIRHIKIENLPNKIILNESTKTFNITNDIKSFVLNKGLRDTVARFEEKIIYDLYQELKSITEVSKLIGITRRKTRERLVSIGAIQ